MPLPARSRLGHPLLVSYVHWGLFPTWPEEHGNWCSWWLDQYTWECDCGNGAYGYD
jgi:hypothetical protein